MTFDEYWQSHDLNPIFRDEAEEIWTAALASLGEPVEWKTDERGWSTLCIENVSVCLYRKPEGGK